MEMEFEGIITMIGQEETVGANNSRKITFVIEEETDREFKGSIAIDLWNDKADLIKDFKEGDRVKAGLNFRAREYNGRRFNGVSAWRLEKLDGSAPVSKADTSADNDLPF